MYLLTFYFQSCDYLTSCITAFVHWLHGSPKHWRHWTLGTLSTGAIEQWEHCTLGTLYTGAIQHWEHCTLGTLYTGAIQHWENCTLGTLYTGAIQHWEHHLNTGYTVHWGHWTVSIISNHNTAASSTTTICDSFLHPYWVEEGIIIILS